MIRSIATVCLSGGLADKLDAAIRVGFDGVEIFENDLLTFDGSPADVRRMCDDAGLAIRCSSRSAISKRWLSPTAPATWTVPNASST